MYRTGQRLTSTTQLTAALFASTALGGLAPALAGELPTGGSVAYGTVGISTPRPNAMAIQQSSGTAIVNWQGFSIGRDARVDVAQPSASSTLLNRVTGATPSTIAGKLNANGQVYLVNPNGIAITKTGTVKAGAFVASTLAISDEDFKAGKRSFTGDGQSAAVTNRGAIEIGRGGYAALIGGKVENAGTVSVPLGKVGLGAGEQATLDLAGDGFLQVAVPSAQSAPGALIRHSGRIRADGGRIEIKAATAREAARHAVNLSGLVEARSVGGRSGAIVLGGGDGGTVAVSGRLAARGGTSAKGGAITVTGRNIRLKGATLDASGAAGGGTIRVGGGYQGKGDLQRAATTSVDRKTRIRADATHEGDGGDVVLWSDEKTSFRGRIRASGGPEGGDGGNAEVSGKALLDYSGFTNLTAGAGRTGTLLLDPFNIFITNAPTSRGTLAGGTFRPNGASSVLNAGDLQAALSGANVTVTTGTAGSAGGQAGNINVQADVAWTVPTTLTLSAARNINVQAGAEFRLGSRSNLVLRADNSGTGTGTVTFGGIGIVGTASGQNRVEVLYNPSSYTNPTNYAAFRSGSVPVISSMLVNTVGDLQDVQQNTAGAYALGRNIDASATQSGAGFDPIDGFTGRFDGRGRTIDGLFMNRTGTANVGLFGTVGAAGTITNVTLTNVNIAGAEDVDGPLGTNVGALVGSNSGTIRNSRASGTVLGTDIGVSAQATVGGLVGLNAGLIERSAFDGGAVRGVAVANDDVAEVRTGGLVGQNTGTVTQAFSEASISSFGDGFPAVVVQGGIAGDNAGTITRAYSESGFVAGTLAGGATLERGGLVGRNGGSLQESYAAGAVPLDTVVLGTQSVGGLVGSNLAAGSVTRSFWDTTATGRTAGAGQNEGTFNAAGLTTPQLRNAAFFVPLATAQGWNFETVWAPPGGGFYPELYTLSPVVRVVANDRARLYGRPNPTLTGQVIGGPGTFAFGPVGDSLVAADALTTAANPASDVGNYAIVGRSVATSALGVAYRVIAEDATLSVTPAPLTIVANNQFKPFGTVLAFTGTEFAAIGLVPGDQVTSVSLASAGAAGAAFFGFYPIFVGDADGTDLGNYDVTFVPGTLLVGLNPEISGVATEGTNLSANLPITTPVGWNPADEIVIEGGSAGGGPTLGTGLGRSNRAAAAAALEFVERASADLERRVAECERRLDRAAIGARDYTSCVADALEQYASTLESRIVELPPPFRGVAATIRQAARQVRVARTVTAARAAVRTAVAEIRKAIALVRADEPEVARIQVRQGNAIASALQSVETKLAKAVGL
jgi:filamentous hemagglutinin family protein